MLPLHVLMTITATGARPQTGVTATIDTLEVAPINAALEEMHWDVTIFSIPTITLITPVAMRRLKSNGDAPLWTANDAARIQA